MENKNKFFKDDKQRELWIKLNAELALYGNNVVNNLNRTSLGSVDEPYSPLWVSRNQLVYDEENLDAPRLSLEQLSSMSLDDLVALTRKQNREMIKELFDINEEEIIEE